MMMPPKVRRSTIVAHLVADQAERKAFLHPIAGGEGVDDGGVDVRVGVEVEGAQ